MTNEQFLAYKKSRDEEMMFLANRTSERFVEGLQAMREMQARFVEQGGYPNIASSIRANWNPDWGSDPGRPAAPETLEG